MNERHGARQRPRGAEQHHQVSARWKQGRVTDVDYQGPQLIEAQAPEVVSLGRVESVLAAG